MNGFTKKPPHRENRSRGLVLHEDRGEWVEESSDALAYPIPANDCAECYADCNVDTWVFNCKVDNIVEEGVHLKCTVELIH